ncbi:MAG: ATP-dependent sacrificial sulfur transferase LarE [Gemmatimonadota bacterium]
MSTSPLDALHARLASFDSALLGYSGGVDSALLAVVGARALGPGRFLAVIGRSPSYPDAQWQVAREIAARFDVPVREVDTREMDDPNYRANPTNRCYFCKSELWRRLGDVAAALGFAAILDGTNADDLGEHRPGLRAAEERQVRSPLAELGWTKAMVREAARALDIPVWDAPSSPCLSSRIAYGLRITDERLRQVEAGEAWLRRLGVTGDLRVRHHGERVRIEVSPPEIPLVERAWDAVTARFRELGMADVELDPRGYRRGSLLTVLPVGS